MRNANFEKINSVPNVAVYSAIVGKQCSEYFGARLDRRQTLPNGQVSRVASMTPSSGKVETAAHRVPCILRRLGNSEGYFKFLSGKHTSMR